jgi:hypothetical protein
MKPRISTKDFGRTGPPVVLSCGCDVLPWEECGCTAWDKGLSLDRVMETAQLEMTFYPETHQRESTK